jgi:DNA-binding SARP family transcriptional activator/Tfp pilus assembly protein PilF
MWLAILGPLQVHDGETSVDVPKGRQRVLLAALVLHAGILVSADVLAEAVWDGSPPPGATVTLRSHILRLRRVLGPRAGARIVTRRPGYLLQAAEDEVDVLRFRGLCRDGGAALREGAFARADGLLGEALGLWRGAALADVPSELLLREEVPGLEELRLQAEEWRADTALHLGRHGELVAGLRLLAAQHPLREHFHAQLMLAFYRCGRQAEALAAYQHARQVLIDEVGTEPGPELQRLHQQVLSGDPALAVPAWALQAGDAGSSVMPRELPPAAAHFTGRTRELATLTGLLEKSSQAATGTVVISAIGGTAGVGKTALALYWAHRVAERFPDGQMYLNLRGFGPSGTSMAPAQAMRKLLEALGIRAEQVPADIDVRAGLYRTSLTSKRMLIVLDNARNADQVRPLLPGGTTCLVIVTSRRQLTGLVATEGAHMLTLDVLTEAEARELLIRHLGAERVAADREAADELIRLCARLPLALTITAARATARPGFPLTVLAAELRDTNRQLDALNTGDAATNIRAVFSWSHRHLAAPAARVFRLLGLHPGPDICAPAAAGLAGIPLPEAHALLSELSRASLIDEHIPGRFAFHDLLRAYAAELADSVEGYSQRHAAIGRVLDYYLHTAHAAAGLLYPARGTLALPPPRAGAAPERFTGYGSAWAWFDAECQVLMAVIRLAARSGFHAHAWQLPWTLAEFLDRRGRRHEWAAIQRTALAAALKLGDPAAQCRARRDLGYAYGRLGAFGAAHTHLQRALDLLGQLDDQVGEARVRYARALLFQLQNDYGQALGEAQHALRLFEAAGHQGGQARTLNSVGWCYARQGDYGSAISYCHQALDMLRDLGDRAGEADTWDSLGYAYHHLGQHAEAITCYKRAVYPYQHLGDRVSQAAALTRIGDTYHAAGNQAAARDAWQQALSIREELRDPASAELRSRLAPS